jgi:hypothetical protein
MAVSHKVASALLMAFFCGRTVGPLLAQTVVTPRPTVQHVRLLPGSSAVEVEITLSEPVAPRTQVVPSPDRLVVDFPQASPGPQLRGLPVNRGDVKAVRVGLFESNPPTTRVVIDLTKTAGFQIFPSGRTVIVKLGGPAANSALAGNGVPGNPSDTPDPNTPPDPPPARVAVGYQNGLLSISAERATLTQVLAEIRSQTGAEVLVPPGADQEKVFANFGPAPAKEVMSALLNGSPYNFILIGSASNPNHLERVLLSQKGSSIVLDVGTPAPQPQPVPVAAAAPPPTYTVPPNRGARRGAAVQQGAADSVENEGDSDEPEAAERQPQAVPQANPQANSQTGETPQN